MAQRIKKAVIPVASMLTTEGLPMSHYVASKPMKELALVSCQLLLHRYKDTGNEHLAIPNTLNREFAKGYPNQIWCGDVTCVWTGRRCSYFAVVLDLYARQGVAWAMSNSPDSATREKALMLAYESRGRPKGLMFHSDQDCHCTSLKFRQTLWRFQIKQSMSRRGNCWHNAPMERFFRSLKTEWMRATGGRSFDEAKAAVSRDITDYCSLLRPYTFNGGLPPPPPTQRQCFRTTV